MNQNPVLPDTDEGSDSTSVYAKTDMTVLVEVFQNIAKENKNGMEELTKLHRNMYNNIIQKQNDELENYRRGALRQSMVHVLREVADIYNENNQDFEAVENPVALLSYVMSRLRELLEDNDVQIVRSAPETVFDRKTMKTQGRYTIPTADSTQDRTVIESITPGYIFFGEPLIQELVSIHKYTPKPDVSEIEVQSSEEAKTVMAMENTGQLAETNSHQIADGSHSTGASEVDSGETEFTNVPLDENTITESEESNNV